MKTITAGKFIEDSPGTRASEYWSKGDPQKTVETQGFVVDGVKFKKSGNRYVPEREFIWENGKEYIATSGEYENGSNYMTATARYYNGINFQFKHKMSRVGFHMKDTLTNDFSIVSLEVTEKNSKKVILDKGMSDFSTSKDDFFYYYVKPGIQYHVVAKWRNEDRDVKEKAFEIKPKINHTYSVNLTGDFYKGDVTVEILDENMYVDVYDGNKNPTRHKKSGPFKVRKGAFYVLHWQEPENVSYKVLQTVNNQKPKVVSNNKHYNDNEECNTLYFKAGNEDPKVKVKKVKYGAKKTEDLILNVILKDKFVESGYNSSRTYFAYFENVTFECDRRGGSENVKINFIATEIEDKYETFYDNDYDDPAGPGERIDDEHTITSTATDEYDLDFSSDKKKIEKNKLLTSQDLSWDYSHGIEVDVDIYRAISQAIIKIDGKKIELCDFNTGKKPYGFVEYKGDYKTGYESVFDYFVNIDKRYKIPGTDKYLTIKTNDARIVDNPEITFKNKTNNSFYIKRGLGRPSWNADKSSENIEKNNFFDHFGSLPKGQSDAKVCRDYVFKGHFVLNNSGDSENYCLCYDEKVSLFNIQMPTEVTKLVIRYDVLEVDNEGKIYKPTGYNHSLETIKRSSDICFRNEMVCYELDPNIPSHYRVKESEKRSIRQVSIFVPIPHQIYGKELVIYKRDPKEANKRYSSPYISEIFKNCRKEHEYKDGATEKVFKIKYEEQ